MLQVFLVMFVTGFLVNCNAAALHFILNMMEVLIIILLEYLLYLSILHSSNHKFIGMFYLSFGIWVAFFRRIKWREYYLDLPKSEFLNRAVFLLYIANILFILLVLYDNVVVYELNVDPFFYFPEFYDDICVNLGTYYNTVYTNSYESLTLSSNYSVVSDCEPCLKSKNGMTFDEMESYRNAKLGIKNRKSAYSLFFSSFCLRLNYSDMFVHVKRVVCLLKKPRVVNTPLVETKMSDKCTKNYSSIKLVGSANKPIIGVNKSAKKSALSELIKQKSKRFAGFRDLHDHHDDSN